MCFISLDREKVRLFIDVLFACLPLLDQEISPFFYHGGRPLVSILNTVLGMSWDCFPLVSFPITL